MHNCDKYLVSFRVFWGNFNRQWQLHVKTRLAQAVLRLLPRLSLHLRRRWSRTPLLHQGKRLFLFPDYTLSVAKKRAAFTDVKRLLHSCPGVKFGLRFPVTLKITLPGGATHTFEDPATAMDFAKVNLKSCVSSGATV